MGCGSIQYNSNKAQDGRPIFKPYPEEINGINDRVSNAFNNFLKSHGAVTKPINRERPKLNFDIKESKSFRKMSIAQEEQRKSFVLQMNNLGIIDESGPKCNVIEDSEQEPEEKSFFVRVPAGLGNLEPAKYKFSITLDADKALKELSALEDEAENITAKYL